jgi:transposase
MAPLRGRSLRGQCLDARVPQGHWKTLTFIAAPRHGRVDAPWVIGAPINAELFATYVEQVLVPTLAPGDIVILDNLARHKGCRARCAIRAAGALRLFLPTDSPDLNPIEQLFAKLKHLMRKAQPSAAIISPTQDTFSCNHSMLERWRRRPPPTRCHPASEAHHYRA